MDYAKLRERVVGFLDEHRRRTDDAVFARAMQRLTAMAVWVMDQNRYKPDVDVAELREQVEQEINLYLHKMYVDGFGDRALHDAVVRGAALVGGSVSTAHRGGIAAGAARLRRGKARPTSAPALNNTSLSGGMLREGTNSRAAANVGQHAGRNNGGLDRTRLHGSAV